MKGTLLPTAFPTLSMRARALREALTVRRVRGHEGIGQLFEYRIEATAPRPFDVLDRFMYDDIDLDRIRDTPATVTIDLENLGAHAFVARGAGAREISGLIASANVLGTEGKCIVYEFVLRPWIWPATLRSNSRVWNGSILDCMTDVLRPYQGEIDWRITGNTGPGANPERDLIRQAWETDWNFFLRLCEEFGYLVWFEHRDGTHVLVIANNTRACPEHDFPFDTLPYHTSGGNANEEHITAFVYSSASTIGTVAVHDHSYMSPRQRVGSSPYSVEYGDSRDQHSFHHETYTLAEFAQPKTRLDAPEAGEAWQEDARHLARVKLEAQRCSGRYARGEGPLRGIQSGKTFKLARYPHHAANRAYVVTRVDLDIRELPTTSGTLPQHTTACSFEVVPADEPYRMPQITPRPRIDSCEYAVIVSPNEYEIWIDEHNRVLIQYPWDREGIYDGRKSIWVRLASPWQGEQMGVIAHARRGDAVLVTYINGDPDRPVVCAFVPDIDHRPPWALPANQALSGMRSRSLEHGTQSNHLALDDTPGRLQAQIASDHGKSSISLGYNTRIDGNKGRQDARGEGIEARTDFWGVLRAAKGWLVTSFARASAAGKVKDMDETLSRLNEARGIHEELARVAQRHGAQPAASNQNEVTSAIESANAALRGSGDVDFPELEVPDIVISSAANVHSSAEGSTQIVSGEHTALTSGGHIAFAAVRSFFVSVGKAVSVFASKSITLITPGRVRVESQTDDLDLIARKVVHILSEQKEILITGKRIVLNGGGTELTLGEDGIFGFTDGKFLVHAATHATDKPQAVPVKAPITDIGEAKVVDRYVLPDDGSGLVMAQQRYRIKLQDGQVIEGISNVHGQTSLVMSDSIQIAELQLLRKDGTVRGIYRPGLTRAVGIAFKSSGSDQR
ncbi:type VI secretion system Vgr family protein [Paraburkholderia sp. J67]|uniref:type VI secretion system Vgr family protein n=1 Tax=Paraburkholderia sp. J67 TaxID=2805435 RepID=UPI002ABD769A|nr:type VI secretion system tip protein TssI/VgrG [Paraburkholderia sp. J67]